MAAVSSATRPLQSFQLPKCSSAVVSIAEVRISSGAPKEINLGTGKWLFLYYNRPHSRRRHSIYSLADAHKSFLQVCGRGRILFRQNISRSISHSIAVPPSLQRTLHQPELAYIHQSLSEQYSIFQSINESERRILNLSN